MIDYFSSLLRLPGKRVRPFNLHASNFGADLRIKR